MTTTKTMKPTAELLEEAKNKACVLSANHTQIRLGGAEFEKSFWLFRVDDKIYIGSLASEALGNFFAKRQVFELVKKDGTLSATMQFLRNAI